MKRLLGLPLLMFGCSKESDIQVYKVPKLPPGTASTDSDGRKAPTSPALAWSDPPGWIRESGSGMRVAGYKLPGDVEVTVTFLSGEAGGDLANVNRWRGQMGLPGIASLDGAITTQKTPLGPVRLVEFDGAGSQAGRRMVAAMKVEGGDSWFFKMTGPAGSVAKARPGLAQLLGSLRRG